MSNPDLFTPAVIEGLDLANRIIAAPMCQYPAVEGCMTDWLSVGMGLGLVRSLDAVKEIDP